MTRQEKQWAKEYAMNLLRKGMSLRENGKPSGNKLFLDKDGTFLLQKSDGYIFSVAEEKIDFSKYKWTGGM